LILCDLEGRTQNEAARKLSIPVGTVSSRLTRGRELMRNRLTRQGLSIAAGGVAVDLAQYGEAVPAISSELVSATVRNARIYLSGTEAAKSELGNKIISLAEGVLHAMLLNQWKTASCLVALLATTLFGGGVVPKMIPSFLNGATADTILYDNFNDGDFADGTPANWFPVEDPGTFSAATGDLVMTPGSAGAVLGLTPEGIRPANGSFRTRVRFTDNSDGDVDDAGFAVRLSGADTYAAGIDTAGLMYIGYVTSNEPFTDLAALLTGFRIQEHDLYLQFDVFGDQLSLSAWRPNEPKPVVPQLQVTDGRFAEGDVGIFANPRTLDSATFRFVQITTDAGEPIPEPEAQTLLSIGAAMFAGCAIFGRRRFGSVTFRRS